MRNLRRFLLIVSAGILICSVGALAQDDDSPSLGDVARQTRQQKQQKDAQIKTTQAKDAQNKDTADQTAPAQTTSAKSSSSAKSPKKVITNEEIPERVSSSTPKGSPDSTAADSTQPANEGEKTSPDVWRQQILAQKNAISQLEGQIQDLTDSIRYAGGNCVSNCQTWNEAQQKKQQQVDSMTSQLGEQQKHLDEMQEQARRQGYGSSVYDP
jgi:hypothetical protein